MIAAEDRRTAADALTRATETRQPIPALTDTWPGFDVDDAYAVQTHVIDARLAAGAKLLGWKVGLTSKAMQQQLGVDQPDFGPLLDDMLVQNDGTVDSSTLIAPKVEGEIAFLLGADLEGPGLTVQDVAAAIDLAIPSLEIIDSRVADWKIKLPDTIADHASCAKYVLGDGGAPLADLDLLAVELTLHQNGEEVGRGPGSAVLGDPLRAVAWLADTLARYGQGLKAGQVVMAGALHAAVAVTPGARIDARTSAPALGDVSVTFS